MLRQPLDNREPSHNNRTDLRFGTRISSAPLDSFYTMDVPITNKSSIRKQIPAERDHNQTRLYYQKAATISANKEGSSDPFEGKDHGDLPSLRALEFTRLCVKVEPILPQRLKQQQLEMALYIDTRGVPYEKFMMSSPGTYIDQSEDELDHYNRARLGSAAQTFSSGSVQTTPGLYTNHLVQEVSLSYSAPLGVSPRDAPLTVSISQGDHIDDYGQVNSGGSLQDYLSHYEARVAKPRQVESVERITTTGRHETEFPVRVAYIGGDSVNSPVHSVPIVSVGHPYRVYDSSRASTPRLASGLTDVIISETTTIEEMTTITTTNQRRSGGEMSMSPNSVNALKQQFEQTARREYDEAQKTHKSSGQRTPPASRVAVVSMPSSDYHHTSEERVRRVDRHAYSPTGQRERVSTTIVDIDPAYRSPQPRYVEETYQVQEEFRTIKSYGGGKSRDRIIVSPEPARNEYVKETIREHVSISRSSSPAREREPEVSRGTTPVRSVVEQFEEKIENETRRGGAAQYGRTESIDEYSVVKREQKAKPQPPKEVFIPRGDYIPSRQPLSISPTPTPEPIPRPITPKEVIIPTRTPEPRPPSPKEIVIPRAPSPKPVEPAKEVEIPLNKEDTYTRTDRTVKVDTWEEITSSTSHRKEPPKEDVSAPEPKKIEPKVEPKPAADKNMFSTSKYETTTRSTRGEDINRYVLPPAPSSTLSNRSMAEYNTGVGSYTSRVHQSGYSVGSGRFRIAADLTNGSLSGLSPFGQNAASAIRDAREREKKEMSDLNDRLASYIEKVRFLEAQNRKLANDLELLTSRWGSDSSTVRVMYETEITTAKVVIDESIRQREALEGEIRRLSAELVEYRKKYEDALHTRETSRYEADELLAKLAKIEAEINLIKRKITYLEEEVSRIKRENQRLIGELSRTRSIIEQESLSRIDFQNQVQTLLEECQYVSRIHSNELGDLVVHAHRDTTPENREYFKNELAAAIRDIRAEYDQITHSNRTDMESWYKLRVQEIHTQSNRNFKEQIYAKDEVKKLRFTLTEMRSKLADLESRNALLERQIQDLNYQIEDDHRSYEAALNERDGNIRQMRDECQALMVELQMLLDTKQTLDAEIAIYRKMLEGEENRAGLRQLVEQVVTSSYGHQHSMEISRVITSESSSRSNYQRSAMGHASITETSPDGRFIVIENTHRAKEENIGEWKLKRKVDGKREYVYTFPRDFILRPMKSVKIFARGQGVHSPPDSLVYDGEENWGTGNSVQTYLYNKEGEERATFIQRQSYN